MVGQSLAAAALLVFGFAVPAAGAEAGCAERFPEVDWVRIDTSVDVYAALVPVGHAGRHAGEIDGAVAQTNEHFGPFEVTVCLFDPDSGFDRSRFEAGSNRLDAVLLTNQGLLVLSTENVGLTGSAAAFGLAHVAMRQYSDGAGFPEPQASTIAQYFRSEVRDRTIDDHAEAKSAKFFGPEVVTPWSAETQQNLLMWDPGCGRSAGFGGVIDPYGRFGAYRIR